MGRWLVTLVTSLNTRWLVLLVVVASGPGASSRNSIGRLLLHGDHRSSSLGLYQQPQHALLRIDRLVVRQPRALPPLPPNVTRPSSAVRHQRIDLLDVYVERAPRALQPAVTARATTMPPLAAAPAHGESKSSSSGGRQQRQGMSAPAQQQQRSASFHGRGTEQQRHHHQPQQKPRPKTLPDLLAGVRGATSFRSSGSGSPSPPIPDADGDSDTAGRKGTRTPSKVLVSVAVQQSMWPLHVMASAEWTVADLVAAAVALYVKEGRRPLLPSTDTAAFGLHYSQFSLESLNPKEKIMELGSRSFFLCPRSSAADQDASSSSGTANGVIRAASGKTPAWLTYMPFWPTM